MKWLTNTKIIKLEVKRRQREGGRFGLKGFGCYGEALSPSPDLLIYWGLKEKLLLKRFYSVEQHRLSLSQKEWADSLSLDSRLNDHVWHRGASLNRQQAEPWCTNCSTQHQSTNPPWGGIFFLSTHFHKAERRVWSNSDHLWLKTTWRPPRRGCVTWVSPSEDFIKLTQVAGVKPTPSHKTRRKYTATTQNLAGETY